MDVCQRELEKPFTSLVRVLVGSRNGFERVIYMHIYLFHDRIQMNWYTLINLVVVFEGRTVICLHTIRDICLGFLRVVIYGYS